MVEVSPELLLNATPEQLNRLKELLGATIRPKYIDWYRNSIPDNWTVPRHIEWLCSEVIEKIIDGGPEWNRVILSMPPQHAKSDTITRRLPVYWGEVFPGDSVLITGYSQEFAETMLSSPARDLATERKIIGQATALKQWNFKGGGSVTVRGVGNPPTGVPKLKLIIIDDPMSSREDAASDVIRKKIWEWYQGSIVQRFWPDTRVILIATRWHENDIIGQLIADQSERWKVINLPAISGLDDPIGRKPGEALWPEQKPLSFLEDQKQEAGAYEFEALFQGNPTPREGSFFKVDNLTTVDVIPPLAKTGRAWDIAHSKGKGDYTAGVKMGRCVDGRYIVLDVRREQLDTDERDEMILETARADGTDVRIRGPQDPGAKAWAKSFTRMLSGYPVHTEIVRKDKETRADPFSSQLNSGNVLMLRGAWNKEYKEELRQFPGGKNDDMVDASADVFEDLAIAPILISKTETTIQIDNSNDLKPLGGGTIDRQGRVRVPNGQSVQTMRIY